VDAARQLAQLVEPDLKLALCNGQSLPGGWRILLELRADQGQVNCEGYQPLLCAVVEVALEPPALGIAGLDDTCARCGQLLVGVSVRERLCD